MTTEPVVPAHPPENADSDPDTESKLLRLYELSKLEASIKAEREALRDDVLTTLEGSRYFLLPDGRKMYGYRVAPEPIEINVGLLESYVSEEILNDVTERKVLKDKFRKAVETGRIATEVFVKVARKKPNKPHVRFGDPMEPPSPYAG